MVWLHYLPHWKETSDPETKLAVFCTGPAIRKKWTNLSSEIIGTGVLVFFISAIGANQFTQGLQPLIIGLLIVAIGLSLGGTTGYAINPARDLGPRIVYALLPMGRKSGSIWRYAPVPILGPMVGAALAGIFVRMAGI